jgi:hypothetical protein
MADDEGRVLAAQSLGCDQHPYAVKQFGCQSRSPADLSTISGAENYCGKWFVAVGSADVL